VLEQVREARASRSLVAGAYLVPHLDGGERHRVVLMEDDLEPVGEGVLLERDPRDALRVRHARRRGGGDEEAERDALGHAKVMRHLIHLSRLMRSRRDAPDGKTVDQTCWRA
jgi:hypothetical protein